MYIGKEVVNEGVEGREGAYLLGRELGWLRGLELGGLELGQGVGGTGGRFGR